MSKYADRCSFERTYTEEVDGISICLTIEEAHHLKLVLSTTREHVTMNVEAKRVIDGIFSDLSIALAKENREGNATR